MLRGALVLVAMVATLALGAGLFVACGTANGESAPSTATVRIRYSQFEQRVIRAVAGQPITITLQNDDPIEHEWIVGTEEVHARHRTGTEPYHDERPEEVTLPALSTRVTTLTFTNAGDYVFICHLPGHEAYGMSGVIRVR